MEYQKIINLLDNTANQAIKFWTKNWIEINDDARGTYNTNSQTKFKTSMLRSSLCDYGDAYILVKGTITIALAPPSATEPSNNDKEIVFKSCAPFTDYISEITNTRIDNAKYTDVVMPMYNLIEYSDNYSKKLGSLWQYYRDEPVLTDAGTIANFHSANKSASFKFKQKIAGKTADGGTKDVEIMVPLKYLSNVWRTLEMFLIIKYLEIP